ncbi:helix-turn-helix transcriptional regulator [Paenibacillus radicis (ex Xue et al. 2023)]|uniref:AraC family transcriptional regulator n=1 Tax=Paenibacillus radicis (ex Xue et al. 2023) TaxID=2972489 RepID=A0ABT1YAJ1_9BACL|nr:AraC family transcriptional regulator [Paenibacillus radicis (ex Xue et al. 2023)]MCR8630211.1 AraC family transcriptional regulator [Paenibacillus radicis (ex Xue et al. 2023)]
MLEKIEHMTEVSSAEGGHITISLNSYEKAFTSVQQILEFTSINLVGEGSGHLHIEDQVIPVKHGDMFIIPSGIPHTYLPLSRRQDHTLVIYKCLFNVEILRDWKALLPIDSKMFEIVYEPDKCVDHWLHFEDRHNIFFEMIQKMYSEYLKRYTGYEALLVSSLVQILVMLQRAALNSDNPTTINKMEEIIQFIKCNSTQNITVQDVAENFYLSSSHFQRLFKRTTDSTFTQYLQNIRVQKSCELLISTDIPIYQVANQVGYLDMKFFHALFRKKMGITPSQYRKNQSR